MGIPNLQGKIEACIKVFKVFFSVISISCSLGSTQSQLSRVSVTVCLEFVGLLFAWGLGRVLQVLERMEQLNEDAENNVEQINERIARLDHCLSERSKKLESLVGVGGKQDADEVMNELEHEKRDQDNRWNTSCPHNSVKLCSVEVRAAQ